MAQADLDRSHPATPYKLEKAREKGQVAKSPEVVSAVVFTLAILFLAWQGWALVRDQFRIDQALIVHAARMQATPATLFPLLQRVVQATLFLVAPFFGVLMVGAIGSNLLQTGPVFSFEPVKADWNRINPAEGFKKVFTLRTLVLGARAVLKLVVLTLVVYYALKSLLPQFYLLPTLSPLGLLRTLVRDFVALGLKIAVALCFIALLDLIYTRWEYAKQMRMSKHEIKEELKQREGDPRIRARLKELRREMLRRVLALRKTATADVLITNPTHVAVALRYVHGEMVSPQLVAKGKGFMAAAMRRIAARHHIPVVPSPSLARALYRDLPLDQYVPPDLYAQVARIIIWVFARRDAVKMARAAKPSPGNME